MKKLLALSLLLFSTTYANMPLFDPAKDQKIAVQNAILAKVNGKTITVIDVMKKLDLIFYRGYPELADSKQARFQFYTMQWRHTLNEMIDTELMVADSKEKELKVTDGEIREEMEDRFGPNIIGTLDQIGLSYDDAWKMVRTEMVVQRMIWFYVHSKAIATVSPMMIRNAYKDHLVKNPPKEEWTYQMVTIQGNEPPADQVTNQIGSILLAQLEDRETLFESFKEENPSCDFRISQEYTVNQHDIPPSHHQILTALQKGEYSLPVTQESRRDKSLVHRIFYLKEHTSEDAPTFNQISNQLKEELLHEVVGKEYQNYITKLRSTTTTMIR